MDLLPLHVTKRLLDLGILARTWQSSLILGEKGRYIKKSMMNELDEYSISKIDVPLIRHGKRQRVDTLINEEARLLANNLRDEKRNLIPRARS